MGESRPVLWLLAFTGLGAALALGFALLGGPGNPVAVSPAARIAPLH
jgi:hypothetical protein